MKVIRDTTDALQLLSDNLSINFVIWTKTSDVILRNYWIIESMFSSRHQRSIISPCSISSSCSISQFNQKLGSIKWLVLGRVSAWNYWLLLFSLFLEIFFECLIEFRASMLNISKGCKKRTLLLFFDVL